ncbi:MAG: T9SS type A sorting domain-containing protein [Saprospiraceae bacterium]|nr:T9SS type A sorting domain-containing protein [Saprospiraceae bacterium]
MLLIAAWLHPVCGQNSFNLAIPLQYPQGDIRHLTLDNDTIAGISIGFNNNVEWKQGVVLSKFDSSGNVLASNIVLDSLGDALAVGKAWGGIVKTSDGGYAAIAATVGRKSAFLIKLNNNLQVEFIKEYPDTVNLSNYAYTLIEVSGGYLLYGAIQRPDYYDDGFIRYVDKQGETIWFKYLSYSVYNNSILDIKQVNDSIYVAGIGTGASINPHTGFTSLLYFDLEGNELNYWASDIEPEIGYVRKIIPTNDGGIILFGLHKADFVSGTALFQPTLSKLDSNFQIEWVSHFGPIRSLVSYITLWDFAPTADGHYIGAGETLVKDGDDPTRRVGWLYKFSAGGDSLWERKVNAPFLPLYYTNSGFFGGVGVLSSGSIVAGGTTNEGNTDYCWLVKVTNDGCLDTLWCQTVVAAPEVPGDMMEVRVYPNPTKDILNIGYPVSGTPRLLQVFDFHGRLVLAIDLPAQSSQMSISTSQLSEGLYFVKLCGENTGSVKFIVSR